MRRVTIEVTEDGKLRVLYQGFKGEACFEEAKKLLALLKSSGVDVDVEKVEKTEEFYVSEKTRQVIRENGF
ncbi:MAG: hypothetical protein QXU09_03815 [Thermoproteota archaeon]